MRSHTPVPAVRVETDLVVVQYLGRHVFRVVPVTGSRLTNWKIKITSGKYRRCVFVDSRGNEAQDFPDLAFAAEGPQVRMSFVNTWQQPVLPCALYWTANLLLRRGH